ncbi:MAG: PIN domain-containing protein [Candidatus Sericytochromatia bacterium]|nr:PIN domain-containing protein [Candidatus Tanganyikabacteria bacterium]
MRHRRLRNVASSGGEAFVDTGAWIALALARDPLHDRARSVWTAQEAAGTRWVTSVPVLIETFTFLSRSVSTQVALTWKDKLGEIHRLRLLECTARDLQDSWIWFARGDLHRLSAVDATSFTLMRKEGLKRAFAFDTHFGIAGFDYLG